jgi:hypothetical protein
MTVLLAMVDDCRFSEPKAFDSCPKLVYPNIPNLDRYVVDIFHASILVSKPVRLQIIFINLV